MTSDYQDNVIPGTCSTACPSPLALLGYADRTLRRSRARKVQSHLEQCESCAELLGLMAETDSPEDLRMSDRALVAGRLGFTVAQPLPHRLLALADTFWRVRTPVLIPVGVAALLLFMFLPSTRPVVHRGATPLVYHFTEVHQLISTDHALRSTADEENSYRATAGSLIFLRHFSSGPGVKAGDPVTLSVKGEAGRERLLLARVSPNGLVEIPLAISRPGTYQLQLRHGSSGSLLATLNCTIHPVSPKK